MAKGCSGRLLDAIRGRLIIMAAMGFEIEKFDVTPGRFIGPNIRHKRRARFRKRPFLKRFLAFENLTLIKKITGLSEIFDLAVVGRIRGVLIAIEREHRINCEINCTI